MRILERIVALIGLAGIFSCDPDNKPIFNENRVKLYTSISNTNSEINLGDTIICDLIVPDTVTSNTGQYAVQTIQRSSFSMYFSEIDTITGQSKLILPPHYWVSRGNFNSINYLVFEMFTSQKPYGNKIHFKPPKKGYYLLEVTSQPGELRINNNLEARLIIDFEVPDKHINMISTFMGPVWTNAALTAEKGLYVFRVK